MPSRRKMTKVGIMSGSRHPQSTDEVDRTLDLSRPRTAAPGRHPLRMKYDSIVARLQVGSFAPQNIRHAL